MSVYKPKGKPHYHFDFRFNGHRFHGSTGTGSRRAAEKHEERQKVLARQGTVGLGQPVALKLAIAHYMAHRGAFARRPEALEAQFARLAADLGPDRELHTITTADILDIVARRRARVTDSTVNRSVSQPLRRVWRLAEKTWKGCTGAGVDWSAAMLREPEERVREMTDSEEKAIAAALRADILPLFRWSLLTGMRKNECVRLRWRDIDPAAAIVTVHGKGDRKRRIPLTRAMKAVLTQCRHHPDRVFTYEKQRARDGRRGERRPVTESVLREVWDAATQAAEIEDLRWHDIRHTAATRLLRASGNLVLVQKLLGHERITTTTKYAHAHVDDLRGAMEAQTPDLAPARTSQNDR